MKNIKTTKIIFLILFFIVLASSSAWSMESKARWLFYGGEEGITTKIRATLTHYPENPFEPIEDGESVRTQSQPPVRRGYHYSSPINIEGAPIREFGAHREQVLKKNHPGEDGRVQVTQENEWPNSVHGIVISTFAFYNEVTACFEEVKAWGTGTCIAFNLILTAARNLYEKEERYGNPIGRAQKVEFIPAVNGKHTPFGRYRVIDFYFPEEYAKNTDDSDDYGLLVLKKHVGEMTGYFGLSVLPPDQLSQLSVNITGYPGDKIVDKKYYEMWGMQGPVTNVDQNFITYEIDTSAGQIGSGVWYQEGDNYFITGIHALGGDDVGLNKATLLTSSRYNQFVEWSQQSIQKRINRGIRRIDLSRQYIGSFGIRNLDKYNLNNLRTLDLSHNGIGNSCMPIIAKIPRLKFLNLYNNYIGDTGAMELAQCPSLRSLNLGKNQVSEVGALALFKGEYSNVANLETVYIDFKENFDLDALLEKMLSEKELDQSKELMALNMSCLTISKKRSNFTINCFSCCSSCGTTLSSWEISLPLARYGRHWNPAICFSINIHDYYSKERWLEAGLIVKKEESLCYMYGCGCGSGE